MAASNSLFEILLLLVLLLVPAIKALLDSHRRKRGVPPPPDGEEVEQETERVRVPPALPRPVSTSFPTLHRPAPLARPARVPEVTDPDSAVEDLTLHSEIAERHLSLFRPDLGPAAVAHSLLTLARRRKTALTRLTGGLAGRPGRDLARAGVLWSEILAVPRALSGPHRNPAARRHRR